MHSRGWRPSSPKERYLSHRDSLYSTKATLSLALSSSSHSRALASPTADPERVVLLRGFYWRSSAADVRLVCEQDFGPVYVQPRLAIPATSLIRHSHGYRRVVLLYQGKYYPEAFVDFVRRRDAARCVHFWAKPTKIYRAKFGDDSRFINWAFGVTAHSYKPPINDKDWAKAWKERNRIERGELPEEVLAPRWKQISVREEEERRMQKRYHQAKRPSASRAKERRPQIFIDSASAGIQDRHSSPLMIEAGVVGDTSMEIDTVLTGATLVGSPSKAVFDVGDFVEKIVEDSDLAALSAARAALQRAAQIFMDTADEFNTLAYGHCASAKAENPDVPYSGSFYAGETSIEGAAGVQDPIGLVQSLFRIQQMIGFDLRI